MFESLIEDIKLKAKARTGASGELLVWAIVGAVCSVLAVVFLSFAAYVWLATLHGPAIAATAVGCFHLLAAAAVISRCIAIRRRNAALALAALAASSTRPPWWSDPAVIAVGYQVAKFIGWRKIAPIIAAGAFAAAAMKSERRPRGGNGAGLHL